VSDAVAARRAGHAVVVLHSDDHIAIREPKLIRSGEVLPTDEIDLSAGAVVLDASYAQRLLDDAASAPRRGAGFGAGSAPSLIVLIISQSVHMHRSCYQTVISVTNGR
jgi:hypothetical protein